MIKLSDLKFKYKFLFAFGVIISLFLISSVWTLMDLRSLIKNAENNRQGRELRTELKQLYIDHLVWSKKVSMFFVQPHDGQINVQTNDHECNLGKWLYSEHKSHVVATMPALESLINQIEEPHALLHKSVSEINKLLQSADSIRFNKAKQIFLTDTENSLNKVVGLLNAIIQKSNEIVISDDAIYAKQSAIRVQLIVLSIITLVFSVLLGYSIKTNIDNSFNELLVLVENMANGNLAIETKINQKDEIGVLAKGLQKTIEKLKKITSEIRHGAGNILAASSEANLTAEKMSENSSEQASSIEEVSSSMEEMTANIEQNKDNAEHTEKTTREAANKIEEGSKLVTETVRSIKTIKEKISVISEIAMQTNILALNAAVEAAHAGEQGKGFAVVAADVRKLAERSQKAAKEIEALTNISVSNAENSGKLFVDIVPAIQNTAKLVQEISLSSVEQNNGANQINAAIQQLNETAQQNAAASEELASNSEEMTNLADRFKKLVSFFKV